MSNSGEAESMAGREREFGDRPRVAGVKPGMQLATRRDRLAAKHLAAGPVGIEPQYARRWKSSPRGPGTPDLRQNEP